MKLQVTNEHLSIRHPSDHIRRNAFNNKATIKFLENNRRASK